MKKIISSILIFASGILCAQTHQPLITYGFEGVPGSMEMNPAFAMPSDILIGIPVLANINLSVHANKYSFEDLIRRDGERTFIDFENISAVTEDNTYLNMQFNTNILEGGLAAYNGGYWSFGLRTNVDAQLNFSDNLMDLILFGNNDGRTVNQWVNLDDLDAEASAYSTWHVGYSKDLNKRLRLGARFKIYNGLFNVSVRENDFKIITRKESLVPDEIEARGSAQIFWTGFDAFGDEDPKTSPVNFSNLGMGIDLGADYMFNKKLYVSASVVDLGFIRWNDNGQGYDVYLDSTFSYTGFAFDFGGEPSQLEDDFDDWSDDNEDNLHTDSLVNVKYTTMMAMKNYVGATYRLSKQHFLSANFAGQLRGGHYTAGIGVNYHLKLKKFLNLRLGYSHIDNQSDIGIGANFRIGAFNMFMLTDNLLSMTSPRSSHGVNFSMGMNLQLRKKKRRAQRYSRTRWEGEND